MSFEVRPARPDELEAVGRLTVQVYVGDGYIDPADRYVLELADTPSRAAGAELWVAVDGEEILGTVTYCPLGSPFRELAHGDEGEFRMLVVAPSARGRGVGKDLVELCLRRSRDLGYAGVRMCSLAQMTSAHRLYERLGFTRVPQDDREPVPDIVLLAYAVVL